MASTPYRPIYNYAIKGGFPNDNGAITGLGELINWPDMFLANVYIVDLSHVHVDPGFALTPFLSCQAGISAASMDQDRFPPSKVYLP